MANLDDLMRRGFSPERLAEKAVRAGDTDLLRQINRRQRQQAKDAARAEREQKAQLAQAEREQRNLQRDAERQSKTDAANMKREKIGFFFDHSIGRVRPITSPTGGELKQYDKSGVLWDPNTGKPYKFENGELRDASEDGSIVTKDGSVYRVDEGQAWKWLGYDKNNLSPDKSLTSNLALNTKLVNEAASAASGVVSAITKDIASDRKRVSEIDEEMFSADESTRTALTKEKESLKGNISANEDRQAHAEIDAYKTQAARLEWTKEKTRLLKENMDAKRELAVDPAGFPNTGRLPDATGQSGLGMVGQQSRESEPFDPVGDFVEWSLNARSDQAVQIAGNLAEHTRQAVEAMYGPAVQSPWNESGTTLDAAIDRATGTKRMSQAFYDELDSAMAPKLAQEFAGRAVVPIKLPEKTANATGLTHAPESWFTPEAMERQLTAKLAGQNEAQLPKDYRVDGGTIYAPQDEPVKVFGVALPWLKTSKDVAVGRIVYDDYGVGAIEMSADAKFSPSFLSQDYYRGLPEYSSPSPRFVESFTKRPVIGSQVVDEVRKEADAAFDAQGSAEDAWKARRWSAGDTRDFLDKWQNANDAQRAELVAEIDPRQSGLSSADRRLDGSWLYENGFVSAQDARLLNKTAYGQEPALAPISTTFDEWIKNGTSKEAVNARRAYAAVKDRKPGFWETLASSVSVFLPAAETIRQNAAVTDQAKRAFLSEYYQQNSKKVDFSLPAYTAARDKLLGTHNPITWAVNGLNSSLQNAAGSSAGILAIQGPKLVLDGIYTKLAGADWLPDAMQENYRNATLTDEEKTLIGAQTQQALRNMYRAGADRAPTLWESLQLAMPASLLFNPDLREKIWSGEKGGELNSALKELRTTIDSGNLRDEATLERLANRVKIAATDFHADEDGGYLLGSAGRMEWENDLLDPRSAMSRNLAAYMQTMDPAYFSQVENAALNSAFEQEIATRAGDYASANGEISETSFLGPLQTAFRGAQVAPITETGIEIGSSLIGFGAGKMLTVGKWMARSERLGLALNRTGRAISGLEDLEAKFFNLGKVKAPIGGSLTTMQKARNASVDLLKQGWASGGGESLEEVVAAFGEAGSTFGDAVAQGIQGVIGGVGLGAAHYPIGAAMGTLQVRAMETAKTKALKTFVSDWNKRYSDTPITVEQARQAQAYQSPELVNTLKDKLSSLITREQAVKKQIAQLPQPAFVPDGKGTATYMPDPASQALASELDAIRAETATTMADIWGVTENSIAAVQEIQGLPAEWQQIADVAVKVASGTPLSSQQERVLLETTTASGDAAAYVEGESIVITDALRKEFAVNAPTTAKIYFNQTESDQVAAARRAPQQAAAPQSQSQDGKAVNSPGSYPGDAGSSPAPATNLEPAGAAGNPGGETATQTPIPAAPAPSPSSRYAFDVTYLPIGAGTPVTVTHRITAVSPEIAATKRDAILLGVRRLGTVQSVTDLQPMEAKPLQTDAPPQNNAFVPAANTNEWTAGALRSAISNAAAAFGYRIVDTGFKSGSVDAWGKSVNIGTAWYDKMHPGSEIGQWIDAMAKPGTKLFNEIGSKAIENAAAPGLHRVWFGHDFATNLPAIVDKFGWAGVPDYIGQLLKDSLTKSGIPFPGVQLLVQSGAVSDKVATAWLSTNIGEVFGGGVAFFGTYRLALAAKRGNITKPRFVFATLGIGIKVGVGLATAQPFLVLSGLADAAILVTSIDQIKAAFKKGQELAKTSPAPAAVEENAAKPAQQKQEANPSTGPPSKATVKESLPVQQPATDGTNGKNAAPAPSVSEGASEAKTVLSIPSKNGVPILEIQTRKLANGRFQSKFQVHTKNAGIGRPFFDSPTYATETQAIAQAKADVAEYVNRTIGRSDTTAADKAQLEKIRAAVTGVAKLPEAVTKITKPAVKPKPVAKSTAILTPEQKAFIQDVGSRFAGRTMAMPDENLDLTNGLRSPAGYASDSRKLPLLTWRQLIDIGAFEKTTFEGKPAIRFVGIPEAGAKSSTPAPQPTASTVPEYFQGQMTGNKVFMAITMLTPWLFKSNSPFKNLPRVFMSPDRLQVSETKQDGWTPGGVAMATYNGRILVDFAELVKQLNSTPQENRQAWFEAAIDEELEHYAQQQALNAAELADLWNDAPDAAKQFVVETYHSAEVLAAGGDWRKVTLNPASISQEFLRIYRQALKRGATTEQATLRNDVDAYAAVNPAFAARLAKALGDIARWMREELTGLLTGEARVRFDDAIARIDAKRKEIEALIKDEKSTSKAPQQQGAPADQAGTDTQANRPTGPPASDTAGQPEGIIDPTTASIEQIDQLIQNETAAAIEENRGTADEGVSVSDLPAIKALRDIRDVLELLARKNPVITQEVGQNMIDALAEKYQKWKTKSQDTTSAFSDIKDPELRALLEAFDAVLPPAPPIPPAAAKATVPFGKGYVNSNGAVIFQSLATADMSRAVTHDTVFPNARPDASRKFTLTGDRILWDERPEQDDIYAVDSAMNRRGVFISQHRGILSGPVYATNDALPAAAAKASDPAFISAAAQLSDVLWSKGYDTPAKFAAFLHSRFADRITPKVLAQVWSLGANTDPDTEVKWTKVHADVVAPAPAAIDQQSNPYRGTDGSLVIPIRSSSQFDPALAAFEEKMKGLADDQSRADLAYNSIPDSRNGKVIGTDIARELLPEYAAGRDGREEYVNATGRVGQGYAKDRLWRELSKSGEGKIILFTAGGVASGKSTAVTQESVDAAVLIFDGTLRETDWAIETIKHAIANGWTVKIAYVQRPLPLVAKNAILRAERTGRWGDYGTLPYTHVGAQKSIIRIAKEFAGSESVSIDYFLNDSESFQPAKEISLSDVDKGGQYEYSIVDEQLSNQSDRPGQSGGKEPQGDSTGFGWKIKGYSAADHLAIFREAAQSGDVRESILRRLAGENAVLQAALTPAEASSDQADPSATEEDWVAFGNESKTLGIPRADMPQVKIKDRAELLEYLIGKGIKITETTIPNAKDSLFPSQAEYSESKSERAKELLDTSRHVFISADNYIVDGHHQYIAAGNGPLKVVRIGLPIREAIRAVADFPKAKGGERFKAMSEADALAFEHFTEAQHQELVKHDKGLIALMARFQPILEPWYEKYKASASKFEKMMRDAAASTGHTEETGQFFVRKTPKGIKRIVEKAYYDGGVVSGKATMEAALADIKDVLAATFVVETQAQVEQTIAAIEKTTGITRDQFNIKDTINSGSPFGYRDIKLRIPLSPGIWSEVILITPSMLAAKNAAGHPWYELGRSIDALKAEENGVLPESMVPVQELITKKAKEIYEAAWAEDMRSMSALNLSESSTIETAKSYDHTLSTYGEAQAPSEYSPTTGEPSSKLTNDSQSGSPTATASPGNLESLTSQNEDPGLMSDSAITIKENTVPGAERQPETNETWRTVLMGDGKTMKGQPVRHVGDGSDLGTLVDTEFRDYDGPGSGLFVKTTLSNTWRPARVVEVMTGKAPVESEQSQDLPPNVSQMDMAVLRSRERIALERGIDPKVVAALMDIDRISRVGTKKTLRQINDLIAKRDVELKGTGVEKSPLPNRDSLLPTTTPQRRAAQAILERIRDPKNPLDWRELFAITDKAWGGTQADGTYTVKDAYDALELAVNTFIAARPEISEMSPQAAIAFLNQMLQSLPTQRKRTKEQDAMQQFSTPPHFAYVANWVAAVRPGDVVLEPSAGIGGLAVFAKNDGATVIANELSERRRAFLKELGFDHVTGENAEQLHAIYAPQIAAGTLPQPTVVVMNPPFSNAAKSGKKGKTIIGANHVEEGLKLLPAGGRLVAIVGEGMAIDAHHFRAWWKNIASKYNVRANILVDGKNYAKYGTTFSNRLLVIDKTGPTSRRSASEGGTADLSKIVGGQVDEISQLPTLLEDIRNDRTRNTSAQPAGDPASQPGGRTATWGNDAGSGTGVTGNTGGQGGQRGGDVAGLGSIQRPGGNDVPSGDGTTGRPSGEPAGGSTGNPASPQATGSESGSAVAESGITITTADNANREIENEDDVFSVYKPAKLHIPGAQPHLAPLVESSAMASVIPPDPTYTPNLPKEVITEGRISETSLESIVYAGQAHAQILPSGERRGWLCGDGTGVGKGRQIAGVIMDNMRQGRTKAVWISEKEGLMDDAKRDAEDIGLDPASITFLGKTKKGAKIDKADGIIFSTYSTLKMDHDGILGPVKDWWAKIRGKNNSRIQQLVNWLGKDFDGVIAFDEAHNASNAIAMQGKRGMKKPSAIGIAVVDLQKALPNARILYVSATAATEVENLAYADRLGIWGMGTPFPNKLDFFNKIRAGGISAMEIVARDLKAQGSYLARSISYKGVEFSRLTQELTPEQTALYNTIAKAWQIVLSNLDAAMGSSGANNNARARSAALSAFWGAQQRFFNQLLTAMELPAVLDDMDAELAKGNSLVLQIVNTNEATQNREIAKKMAEAFGLEDPTKKEQKGKKKEKPSVDLEDIDLSPLRILLQYIDTSFPTTKFEQVQDPNNPDRTVWQPARDSAGNIIQDPESVAIKLRLNDEVALLDVPKNPLDQIIDKFGEEAISEVTGRTQRMVGLRQQDGTRKTQIQRRNKSHRKVEAKEFQDGKRRILIFSDAGGTGFSFHASNRAKNKQRRVHYLVQAGWRADKALQGFGRTHRTDQASAPIYKLAETNIAGHKRFISTIARRLSQLGALTTGERKSKGSGLFSETDNLESEYAEEALTRLIYDLHASRVENYTFDQFSAGLGFNKTITDDGGNLVTRSVMVEPTTGQLIEEKIPAIPQFLNRVLALPLDEQNLVFDLFMSRLESRIKNAMDDGTYDPGTQSYKAEQLNKISDEVVFSQKGTGSKTRIVEIEAVDPIEFTSFDDIPRLGSSPVVKYVRNRKSGRLYALKEAPKDTDQSGAMVETFRRIGSHTFDKVRTSEITTEPGPQPLRVGDKIKRLDGMWEIIQVPTPENPRQRIIGKVTSENGKTVEKEWSSSSYDVDGDLFNLAKASNRYVEGINDKSEDLRKGGHYEEIPAAQAADLWQAEIDGAEKYSRKKVNFLVGAMLPVWDRIQLEHPKVYRFTTSEGEPMLGVLLPPRDVPGIRQRMGAKNTLGPQEVFDMARNDGGTFGLANGWTFRRVLVSGEHRIEISGLNYQQSDLFVNQMGGQMERIAFKPRHFIPTVEVMEKVLAQSPVITLNGQDIGNIPPPAAARRGISKTDAAYLAAVSAGDMETAQRMVDEAAKAAGYVNAAFHGAPDVNPIKNEGVFKTIKDRMRDSKHPDSAYFFTDDYSTAKTYADAHRAFDYQAADPGVIHVFLKLENPLRIDGKGQKWKRSTQQSVAEAKSAGHDGYIVTNTSDEYHPTGTRESTVFAVFAPSQIKSADPVTRDASGNVIPLSQRFNPETPLIAFAKPSVANPAAMALFNDNLALATWFADKYRNIRGVEFEDLLQESRIGLWKAADRFEADRGIPFGAYASAVIRNRLNELYNRNNRHVIDQMTTLDAPIGDSADSATAADSIAARIETNARPEDVSIIREEIDKLPKRARETWEAFLSGQTWDEIAKNFGISKQGAQQYAKGTNNTLRAALAKRGIRSVDDVFPQKDAFNLERLPERRSQIEDEENWSYDTTATIPEETPDGATVADVVEESGTIPAPLIAFAKPSAKAEAELSKIEAEAARARAYREDHKKAAVSNGGIGAQQLWKTHLSGRLDKLDYYAPGAKAAILDDRREEALVAATINAMMDTMRQDIKKAFGYPQFWQKQNSRLQQFLDEILPTAARLEASHLDDDGNFVFRDFQMRTGILPFGKARVLDVKPGQKFMDNGELFTVGELVDGKGFVLLRDMLAEDQQVIFDAFHDKFPESAHYLDRFIMPGIEEARYMGPQGTMTAEFNRHALRDLFNDWPQELRDLFGPMPLPDMPYVEGYTPDVAEQKTLVAMIGSLLRKFKSGARKFKAGEARESGNIKNLFDGFSIRAMEAHREKIRIQTRQKLIEAAAVPETSIPREERDKYVAIDTTFARLMDVFKLAGKLDRSRFKNLTDALSPADNATLAKLLGDAYRLRGRGLMIHKEVERELVLGVTREISTNGLLKIFAGLLERYNSGLLSTPFTTITNWASNEVMKTMRVANRFNYAMVSAIAGDIRGAKLGAYEMGFLLRGFITDRFPQWQRQRIGEIVPRELFDDQTQMEAFGTDPNKSVWEQVQRLNLGGAFLKAIKYGEIDVRQKQQLAYAAYRAHAEVAADEAGIKGPARKQWTREWMKNAPAEIHRDVYMSTVLYMMDYQNVPAWLDPSQSNSAIGQVVKRAIIPFAKWPYNAARQFKRFSLDAGFDLVLPGRTKEQRINGAANLMVMAGLTALGAWLAGSDDDDDKLIGTNVDEEGKLLEAAFRTGNRINVSRLARIIFAHGLMRGATFSVNGAGDRTDDIWWRYRNYPYLKEGILLGLAAKGNWGEFGKAFGDISGEYVSLGLMAKVLGLSAFDRDKPVPFRTTEAIYDIATAGAIPTPWRQLAVKLADPVRRKNTPLDSMGYGATAIDAIKVNTPFLSKSVPSGGTREHAAFAPFNAQEWFKKEASAIAKDPSISPEEKAANTAALRQQALKLSMPALTQRDIFRDAGLPVDKMRSTSTDSVPAASHIQALNKMGIGPESYTYSERSDKNGRVYREVVYPDPATVGLVNPTLEALKFFGGVNLMMSPARPEKKVKLSRPKKTKPLTAGDMFAKSK